MNPVGKVHSIRVIRSGILAATLLFIGFSYNVLCPAQTHALSLSSPLASLNVNLPTGDLLTPVTNITNPVTSSLPVSTTIQSTPDTVGLSTNLPILDSSSQSTPTADLNVSVPVVSQVLNTPSQAVNSLLSPARNPLSARSSSAPATSSSTSPSSHTGNPPKTATVSQKPANSSGGGDSHKSQSPLAGITSFFSSTLPDALRHFASSLVGKPVDLLPIIISVVILLLTLGSVGGIIHASNNNGMLTLGRIGRINLTKIAEAHDVAQIATLVIATVSFGVVASFLVLAGL